MFFHEAVPQVYEFFISVGVLLIAALLILTFFISTAIDFAMRRRVKAKKQPVTRPPKPEYRPPTRNKVKIERQTTTSRRRKNPPTPNAVEIARAARVQAMLEAHRRGLRRLYLGRQRAMINIRAVTRIREKDALEFAERHKDSKQVYSQLAANFKEKQRQRRAWVKQIEESNSEPLAVLLEKQMKMRSSVQVGGGFGGPELSPARHEENIRNPSKDANETEESRKPAYRVLGDSKAIKMKFGKNNKLASLLESSKVGDGFYVFL